jgi:hypothetical protein
MFVFLLVEMIEFTEIIAIVLFNSDSTEQTFSTSLVAVRRATAMYLTA